MPLDKHGSIVIWVVMLQRFEPQSQMVLPRRASARQVWSPPMALLSWNSMAATALSFWS